jgi:hypothetical protein
MLLNQLEISKMNNLPLAYVIEPSGTIWENLPANGTDYTLAELKDVLDGGYIEIKQIGSKLMVLDEDGKGKNLPYNPKATALYLQFYVNDFIVGPVLVCPSYMVK